MRWRLFELVAEHERTDPGECGLCRSVDAERVLVLGIPSIFG